MERIIVIALNNRPQFSNQYQQCEEHWKTLYALRVDLSSRLSAEAFEISPERLIKRNAVTGSTAG